MFLAEAQKSASLGDPVFNAPRLGRHGTREFGTSQFHVHVHVPVLEICWDPERRCGQYMEYGVLSTMGTYHNLIAHNSLIPGSHSFIDESIPVRHQLIVGILFALISPIHQAESCKLKYLPVLDLIVCIVYIICRDRIRYYTFLLAAYKPCVDQILAITHTRLPIRPVRWEKRK